jgi:hypothetical protein
MPVFPTHQISLPHDRSTTPLYWSECFIVGAESDREARNWKPGAPVRREPRPLWWSYLSQPTKQMFQQVRALEARTGDLYIDFDSLCGCQDTTPPVASLQVVQKSPRTALVLVTLSSGLHVRLMLALESGWKINDITDDNGAGLVASLRRALRR